METATSWLSSWWYGQQAPAAASSTKADEDQQRRSQQPDLMFKTIVIGDGRVGKSSLLARYADRYFSEFSQSTYGVDFKRKVLSRRQHTINLEIWDTAGQERFRAIACSYYRGAAGIVLAFDLTNPESFESMFSQWIPSIAETLSSEELARAAFVVVGTKSDLPRQLPPTDQLAQSIRTRLLEALPGMQRFVDTDDDMDADFEIAYLETSAKDNICVDECFERLVDTILDRRESIRRQIEFSAASSSPDGEEGSFFLGQTRAVNPGMWASLTGWC